MKVAMLTSTHSPFDVRIFHREAMSLAGAGHDVSIIAPCKENCVRGGIRIIAVPPPRNRLIRIGVTAFRVAFRSLRERFDVVHFHDPDLLPFAIVMAALGRAVIYDAHEHYFLRIRSKEWLHPWMRLFAAHGVRGLEQVGARLFKAVVGPGPEVLAQFPACKAVMVANRPPLSEATAQNEVAYCERSFNAVYVGGIEFERGAMEMVRAVALARRTVDVKLVLAGRASRNVIQALQCEPGWRSVHYHGVLDRSLLGPLLSSGRVGLLLLHPTPQYRFALATKVFDYMAAGMPVIVPDFPVWRDLLDQYNCGVLVDPLDPAGVATAIEALLTNQDEAAAMGARGREAVLTELNWENEERKLLELYSRLAL